MRIKPGAAVVVACIGEILTRKTPFVLAKLAAASNHCIPYQIFFPMFFFTLIYVEPCKQWQWDNDL